MLIVILGASKDTGQLTIISDLDNQKNYIYRTNELVNIFVRPFLNSDPTMECIFEDNVITLKTIGYQLSIVFNVQNFETLRVSLLSNRNTIEKISRTQFKSVQLQKTLPVASKTSNQSIGSKTT